uniref:Uncharacterized protein n=1 Tax=Cannabis sativa TaxID=3483 RepID=A0A803QBV6_CANSA
MAAINGEHGHDPWCNSWKQAIKIHPRLPPPPHQILSEADQAAQNFNPEYLNWEVQDQLLVSWLLSSMSESLLTRMVGCNSTKQIWKALEQHFTLKVSSKILEFIAKLQMLKKGTLNLNDYLLKVKQHVDLLAFVGEIMSDRDHIAAIFKGLPSEYDTFIISTNTWIGGYTVGEIEALLLAFESRIEKEDQEVEPTVNIVTADHDPTMEAFFAQTSRNYRSPAYPRGQYWLSSFNSPNFPILEEAFVETPLKEVTPTLR